MSWIPTFENKACDILELVVGVDVLVETDGESVVGDANDNEDREDEQEQL